MKFRQIIGDVILMPLKIVVGVILLPEALIWFSGPILHIYTAFAAYGLAGPGSWGHHAAGLVLMLPVVGEIAVFIGAWSVTGNFLNDYSEWLFYGSFS